MKILILGAGSAGSSVASALASEENEITVIDRKQALLDILKAKFDIATVAGNAAHPRILELGGVQTADMVIAVTDRDETNMLACLIISKLYRRPKTIARVRAIDFLKNPQLFEANGIPVDVVISPELIVMESIRNLIEFPGVLHVSSFADGLVKLFSVKVVADSFLVDKQIKGLRKRLSDGKIRIVAIFRQGKPQIVNGDADIQANDEVFFVVPSKDLKQVLKALHVLEPPIKRIIIAGGGHVGKRLALALENDYQVKVIEKNVGRAQKIAYDMNKALILCGDCTDESLLRDEFIEHTDLFCSVTEQDDVNIIASSVAKTLGARKAICLLNQVSYAKLLPSTGIDVAVLPNQETLGTILKHVRHGDMAQVYSLCGGIAEAIEAIAHRHVDSTQDTVVGKRVNEIGFPAGIVMGALIRNRQMIEIHHDTLIEEGDHVVMFALDKKMVATIERFFQPI